MPECIVRTYLFSADNDLGPRHTKIIRSCSSGTPHLMDHGSGRPVETRGRPHDHGGRRSSSRNSTPHLMGSGPGRPVSTHGPLDRPGRAAHIEPTSHGPRPGPIHQIARGWAAARLSQSHFHFYTARPGPVHHIIKRLGLARPRLSHFRKSRPDPARPVTIF